MLLLFIPTPPLTLPTIYGFRLFNAYLARKNRTCLFINTLKKHIYNSKIIIRIIIIIIIIVVVVVVGGGGCGVVINNMMKVAVVIKRYSSISNNTPQKK